MENVLFITNEIYLDLSKREGGVRNCTFEFIDLLKTKFNVIPLGVSYHKSLLYRFRVKMDLNIYNDYNANDYNEKISSLIKTHNIKFVFLNLSNTIPFSKNIKSLFKEEVKVILCSHGNESGDYLHTTVQHFSKQNIIKRGINAFVLGSLLRKESIYRNHFLDMVLSISEVEYNIEKWLGTPITYMVPRVIKQKKIEWKPIGNYFGFIGDLSHTPNFFGVSEICKALEKNPDHGVTLRLVGGPEHIGNALAKQFSFVHYCGFLPEDDLIREVGQWSYFLNLVFYYSRGVSTKLAKAIEWGIPIITTTAGNRGYPYIEEMLPKADRPNEMADLIVKLSNDPMVLKEHKNSVNLLIEKSPSFENIMEQLYPLLNSL